MKSEIPNSEIRRKDEYLKFVTRRRFFQQCAPMPVPHCWKNLRRVTNFKYSSFLRISEFGISDFIRHSFVSVSSKLRRTFPTVIHAASLLASKLAGRSAKP